MKQPKFSLGSWAFSFGPFENNPWSFKEFLSYAAKAQYDGIEINGFRPHPHPDDFDTKSKCTELLKQIEGYGLGISGYAPDFTSVPPREVSAAQYLHEIEKSLKFCNHMGIRILRVDTVSAPGYLALDAYQERFNRLANTWRLAAELCQKMGVLLVWEFEPGFWLNKPSEIKEITEAIDHPNFKLLFDTSHAYMCSVVGARQSGSKEILPNGLVALANNVKNHIGHFHLIDSDGTLHDEETSTHAPFGTGNIDFTKVIKAMKAEVEPLEWWCFDFCFCPTTEEDARKAIPFVENVINTIR
ncbi:sugar phosphate isomerase/epimerase family protein [Seonamhaeicola sp.]|uniref:sugar phosphate isomerase/epimerase family protein n=1 Tax=Seonamhaeicola sp. TaxID=1912245 RepID=UPI00261C2FBE|nr:sugar phosphate isomerase/epimerase family protein [Seonamhaeicola sp.]